MPAVRRNPTRSHSRAEALSVALHRQQLLVLFLREAGRRDLELAARNIVDLLHMAGAR